jgi:hypothetical protein
MGSWALSSLLSPQSALHGIDTRCIQHTYLSALQPVVLCITLHHSASLCISALHRLRAHIQLLLGLFTVGGPGCHAWAEASLAEHFAAGPCRNDLRAVGAGGGFQGTGQGSGQLVGQVTTTDGGTCSVGTHWLSGSMRGVSHVGYVGHCALPGLHRGLGCC